jgi:UDP-N-acetylglucosamine 2-epimerase (non-hydrolysing)
VADDIMVIFGTRPEMVKLAGIVRQLSHPRVVHTGQHYSPELSDAFLRDLQLGEPDVRLEIGGATRGEQIGHAVGALDAVLRDNRPAAVVVQGDTNTALAGALAANANDIPIVHVEAGLRSFDRAMPEEHNRILVDHIADLCLAPTETSRQYLRNEGIDPERIVVTGNTVVEAVTGLLPSPAARARLATDYGVVPGKFVLATFHRPENVDDVEPLREILDALGALPMPVVLPLHPRTAARAEDFGLGNALARVRVTESLPYASFLGLAAEAALLVSDSGGLQEEASVIKRPLIVVRNSTERPEVIGTFATRVLPGPDIERTARAILADLDAVLARLADTPSPYGDGTASAQSVRAIESRFGTHP